MMIKKLPVVVTNLNLGTYDQFKFYLILLLFCGILVPLWITEFSSVIHQVQVDAEQDPPQHKGLVQPLYL